MATTLTAAASQPKTGVGSFAETQRLLSQPAATTPAAKPGRDELPAGVAYQTYNPDGSVRTSETASQKSASDAADISNGVDTPEGVGGELTPTTAPAGTQNTPVNPQATGANAFQNAGGLGGSPVTAPDVAAPEAPPSKYQQGLTAATAAGFPAPQKAGEASMGVAQYTPSTQQGQGTSAVDNYIASDPNVNNLMQSVQQLLNPAQQTSSLLDDYNELYKESGLDAINKEMIDADTVINGTEDDIRNEIQTAGGLGTDSQVQAMANARNKGLLKRYNQLVQMKTDATNQLNTLSSLNAQDKQMAQTRVNTQIETMFKLADYQQQAQNNIKEGFNNIVAKVGYAGAYQAYANSPQQLASIEQVMGLEPGGLKQLAAQPDLDIEAKQASINASNASTASSYSNIAKNNADIAATQTAKIQAVQNSATTADTVLSSVSKALGQVSPVSSGLIGGVTTAIPASPSKNLQSTIATIKSNLAFTELAKLKAASPTGGALGSISDKEEELLSSTVANLDVGQSSKQLTQNLQAVQTHYINYLNSLGYSYDAATGTVISP